MSAAQRPVAQLQSLIQDLPEALHVSFRGARHIHQIDGNYALVKSSIELVASVSISLRIFYRQEGTASHTRIYLSLLQLFHDLCGNIIRNHPLSGTFCRQLRQMPVRSILGNIILVQHVDQLRERRCDPHALFIFDTLHPLDHHLFDDHCQVVSGLPFRHFVQVHEHRYKRRLSVTGHQRDQLVLDRLDTAFDLVFQALLRHLPDDLFIQGLSTLFSFSNHVFLDLLTADIYKRRQMRQCKGLTSVLVAGYLRHDLGGYVAGCEEAVRLLNQRFADHSAILQHILQVDQITVVFFLCKIIRIMEMNDSLLMRFHDLLRQKHTSGQILADLSGHVIPLRRVDHRIFIGIFLIYFFIDVLDQRQDPVVCGIGLSGQFSFITIPHIFLRHLVASHLHDAGFHQILDVLHIHRVSGLHHHFSNLLGNRHDLIFVHLMDPVHLCICFCDRIDDLGNIKGNLFPISLDYFSLYV